MAAREGGSRAAVKVERETAHSGGRAEDGIGVTRIDSDRLGSARIDFRLGSTRIGSDTVAGGGGRRRRRHGGSSAAATLRVWTHMASIYLYRYIDI